MSKLQWCKKHRKLLCIDFIGIMIAIILSVYMQHVISLQYSQQQAARWAADGDIRYHQVSAFIQEDCAIGAESITEVRSVIQQKLIEASYAPDSVTGRLWIDSYMAGTKDSVTKQSEIGASGVDSVNILGVGGDFFYFHPMNVISGSTFADKDISQDRVLLDEETAWALYGATDIAGKTVDIAGRPFVISGVYRAGEDKSEKLAKGNESYIFIDYDTFHDMYENKSIFCYEATLPNPVSGFALLTVKEAFGEAEEDMYADDVIPGFSSKEYVDNTSRFETLRLLKKLFYMPRILMRTTQVSYPYWENSIRALEWKLEIVLLIEIICLILPIVTICILAVILGRQIKTDFGKWIFSAKDYLVDKWDEKARARMRTKALRESIIDDKVIENMKEDVVKKQQEKDDGNEL